MLCGRFVSCRVALDACVLFPFSLRDTLLRLAELEFYDVLWSERILDEMSRNLIKKKVMSVETARRTVRVMSTAFEDAAVPPGAIESLEPVMTNHWKDRHVLAAAVVGGADAVVTKNLRDFADEDCTRWGVRSIRPDEFLLGLLAKDQGRVLGCLQDQAGALKRPPVTFDELLGSLHKEVPEFVAAVLG